jgi:hypothetical protein
MKFTALGLLETASSFTVTSTYINLILYCIILYYIYYIILYCIILHILYYIVLYYIILYCIVLYYTYYIILYYIIYIILYCIVLYYIILYYIVLFSPPNKQLTPINRISKQHRLFNFYTIFNNQQPQFLTF